MYCFAQIVLNTNRVTYNLNFMPNSFSYRFISVIESSLYSKFLSIVFILEMDTENVNPNGKDVSISPTTETTFNGIEWPDYVVIALYFVSVLAVGLYVSITI